ncbi:MAG TPA: hypothetical protein VMZ27_15575 [Candidatus Saccharimonadales bacterium]|nr:hypothetical protein [Candidatus Saccharimonadales bacterium]
MAKETAPHTKERARGITLVCFAVKEEGRFFRSTAAERLITGMGSRNAKNMLEAALRERKVSLVLSCGFGGGLNPELEVGKVVFQADDNSDLKPLLIRANAIEVKFHFCDRVATTTKAKQLLREQTGADVVEMESWVIREICKERGIPSATVRVISDAANQDLPLDFNELLTTEQRLSYGKLIKTIVRSPRKIPALLQLQKQTTLAARNLADVLEKIISARA